MTKLKIKEMDDMHALKQKLLDEMLGHLANSQGGELKSMLDESKAPVKVESVEVMSPESVAMGDKKGQTLGDSIGFPKKSGLEGDQMASNDEPEMSDDEFDELLKKHLV